MTFSIIIPVKPGGYVAAGEFLKTNLPDDPCYEVILAEGRAPSQQRNLAAGTAQGDILYFLDDDSLIKPENLAICAAGMSDPKVAVIGGPSVTPSGDSRLQKLFGYALSSAFGSGAVHNRYRIHGRLRKTNDKELILCNLAVRRSVFLELGGFNECLYPNEENEFIERLIAAGYTSLHNPDMFIFRSQRRSLKSFMLQMFSYGRGRGQQTLITSSFSITSFIPLFFVCYLFLSLIGIKYVLLLLPLMLYLSAALAISLWELVKTGNPLALFLFGLFPLMHCINGVGLLWGILNGKPSPVHDNSIQIRIIKSLGESFPHNTSR